MSLQYDIPEDDRDTLARQDRYQRTRRLRYACSDGLCGALDCPTCRGAGAEELEDEP